MENKTKRHIILYNKGLTTRQQVPLGNAVKAYKRPPTVARTVGAITAILGVFTSFSAPAAVFDDAPPVAISTAFLIGTGSLAIALLIVGLSALRQRTRRLEAADFLRLTFENMAHGAIVYDAHQKVAAFNQRYIDMLGMPPGTVFIGQTLANILRIQKRLGLHAGIDIETFIGQRYDEIKRGLARRLEVNLPDGRTLVMRSGAVRGRLHVSSFIDITERKRLEQARLDSESRLRSAASMLDMTFENMAQGALVLGADMRVVAFNRRYLELFELPPDVVFVGQTMANIIRARYERGHYPNVRDIDRYIATVYEELRNSDTKVQDYDLPTGGTVAMRRVSLDTGLHIATFTDITERRRAELALKESEGRIRAILDHAADAIMTIARDGVVLSINPATERIFGYSDRELVGRDIRDLMPDGTTIWPPAGTSSVSGETKGRRKDGALFPLEMSCARTRLGDTEVGILILRDVTQQKEMQLQLMHSSKLATVGQMAAGLAHEMNQPLNVIRMAADNSLIRMEKGSVDLDYLREKLELIGNQSEKVGKMILHLRVFARTEAPDLKPFNPIESVRSAVHLMDLRLKLANIDFDLNVPERCAPVLGRSDQLEQVIINLLSNAHDAVLDQTNTFGENTGRISVTLSEDVSNDTVVIKVSDNGGGIPSEIRDRVFDPFFTTKEVGQGTGLGLSICSTTIAEMKGRIEIANSASGTEMIVILPVYRKGETDSLVSVKERMQ